jgi:hypothetical protein
MFDHRVQNRQQFAHTSDQSDFGWFSGVAQSGVENFDDQVATTSDQGSHVKRRAHIGSPSPDNPFPSERATVVIERGDPRQLGDLFTIESAELRHLGDQCTTDHRTDSWGALKDLLVGLPERVLTDHMIQIMIGALELFFQEANVIGDASSDDFRSAIEPVVLGHDHSDDLAAPSDEVLELPASLIRQCTELGAHHFSEVSQKVGIDAVGFSQLATGSGKIPDLARVDHLERDIFTSQSTSQCPFQIAGGLQDDQRRLDRVEPLHQGFDPGFVVGETIFDTTGADTDIESRFADIDTDKDRTVFQNKNLLDDLFQHCSTLQRMRALGRQATVRAYGRPGRDDPCLPTDFYELGVNDLSRPVSF